MKNSCGPFSMRNKEKHVHGGGGSGVVVGVVARWWGLVTNLVRTVEPLAQNLYRYSGRATSTLSARSDGGQRALFSIGSR